MLLAAAIPLALLAACADADSHAGSASVGKGVNIPASWMESRLVSGHHLHVLVEKIACAKCHNITEDSVAEVRKDACIECHEDESQSVHAEKGAKERWGPKAKSDCLDCHAFVLGDDFDGGTDAGPDAAIEPHPAGDCGRCHKEAQGDTPAVEVHGTRECLKCHDPHAGQKPKSAPCSECHGDTETTHAAEGRGLVEVCTTCHQSQHGLASDAKDACAKCHAEEKPTIPAAALFEGHKECIACHQPHRFGKAEAVLCTSCHDGTRTIGAPRVRDHGRCNSCHAAHDVKNSPDRACAACHKDKKPDHPKKGNAGTCVGCHDPHPPANRRHSRARNCSSCHQEAHSERAYHGGTDCKQCHTPHNFKRALSNLAACSACHAKQVTVARRLSDHTNCQSCHQGLPHKPSARSAACVKCHETSHKQVVKGHTKCSKCHEPHGGQVRTACRDCHKEEHRTAPAGHQDCTSCHQPHSGSAKSAPCVKCHKTEAKSAHGLLKKGCQSCHRPHGPSGVAGPPSCGSCHKKQDLPGLHSFKEHSKCNQCHTGHGPARGASKATCLSCHRAQKNHEPEAATCVGCHLFGKNR